MTEKSILLKIIYDRTMHLLKNIYDRTTHLTKKYQWLIRECRLTLPAVSDAVSDAAKFDFH